MATTMLDNSTIADTIITDHSAGTMQRIFDNTVCLSLKISKFGITRAVSKDQVIVQTNKKFMHVSKDLFKCAEYSAICKLDEATKAYLKARCLSASILRGGEYLLPVTLVPNVHRYLQGYKIRRRRLVSDLCEAFPRIIAESQTQLEVLFNLRDYPTQQELAESFSIDERYRTFDNERLRSVAPSIYEYAMDQASNEVKEVAEECRNLLRTNLNDLVAHLADKLTPSEDGKRKVLRTDGLAKLNEYLTLFDQRNLTDDQELRNTVNRLRETMGGISVEAIKNSEQLKANLAVNINAIKTELAGLVVPATRRFIMEED